MGYMTIVIDYMDVTKRSLHSARDTGGCGWVVIYVDQMTAS